jgi:hypothetical protein
MTANIFDASDDSDSDDSDNSEMTFSQELELYLCTKPNKNIEDPIPWWIIKNNLSALVSNGH